ncbi:MAG: rod-binding protein [Planctomyces sp.]
MAVSSTAGVTGSLPGIVPGNLPGSGSGLLIANSAPAKSSRGAESAGGPTAEDVGKQFESLLVSMMLKQMRQTSLGEGMFPGDKSDTFGGMFDMYMGDHIAQSSDLGITQLIESGSNSVLSFNDASAEASRLRSAADAAYGKGIQAL